MSRPGQGLPPVTPTVPQPYSSQSKRFMIGSKTVLIFFFLIRLVLSKYHTQKVVFENCLVETVTDTFNPASRSESLSFSAEKYSISTKTTDG